MKRLLPALLLLLAGAAFAQSIAPPPPGSFSVPPTDLSITILKAILGDWSGSASLGGFGEAMRVFNGGVMVVGTVMFAYIAIMGVAATAHDGQVLGKQWSSMWVPLRLVIGVAALTPTATGLSMVQIFVLWVAAQGIGFGNVVWTAYLRGTVSDRTISVQMAERGDIENVMRSVLLSEACVQDLVRRNPTGGVVAFGPNSGGQAVIDGNVVSWGQYRGLTLGEEFGDPGYSHQTCGSIEFPSVSSTAMTANPGMLATATSWVKGAFADINKANAAVARAERDAVVQAAELDLRPLAIRMATPKAAGTPSVKPADVDQAVALATSRYRAQVSASMSAAFSSSSMKNLSDSFRKDAERNGWINAGMHYYTLAAFQTALNSVVGVAPIAHAPKIQPGQTGQMQGAINASYAAYAQTVIAGEDPTIKKSAISDSMATVQAAEGQQGWVFDLWNSGANTVARKAGYSFGYDPTNSDAVLVQLKNSGDYMLGAVQAAMLTAWGASKALSMFTGGGVVSAAIDKVPFLGKLLHFLTDTGMSIAEPLTFIAFFGAMGLLMTGLTMSIYLPMLPFILWIGTVISYLGTVVEAVVATPIWAAAHLSPEGDSLAGKHGANGWQILLEVFAKPVFSIFGLIAAMMMMEPIFAWFSEGFWVVQQSVSSNSIVGVISMVAFVMLYVSVCITVLNRILGMIHALPAQAFRWVGAHWGSYMGQGFDQQIESGAKGSFGAGKEVASQGVSAYRGHAWRAGQKDRESQMIKTGKTPQPNQDPKGGK